MRARQTPRSIRAHDVFFVSLPTFERTYETPPPTCLTLPASARLLMLSDLFEIIVGEGALKRKTRQPRRLLAACFRGLVHASFRHRWVCPFPSPEDGAPSFALWRRERKAAEGGRSGARPFITFAEHATHDMSVRQLRMRYCRCPMHTHPCSVLFREIYQVRRGPAQIALKSFVLYSRTGFQKRARNSSRFDRNGRLDRDRS